MFLDAPQEIEVIFNQVSAFNDGETVVATCHMGPSKPAPEVSWSILTHNGLETATSLPLGATSGLQCDPGVGCNSTISFVASAELTGAIIRCTARNAKIDTEVATDRRLDVLFKPRTSNPSRCFSRFLVEFNAAHNLSEHCSFEANPPVDATQTHVWLVSATNANVKQRLSPESGYPAQQDGQRPPWEMIQITRRLDSIEDLNFLDSFLVITLQNSVGFSEFKVPVRINRMFFSIPPEP